jgi:hypothetical protein
MFENRATNTTRRRKLQTVACTLNNDTALMAGFLFFLVSLTLPAQSFGLRCFKKGDNYLLRDAVQRYIADSSNTSAVAEKYGVRPIIIKWNQSNGFEVAIALRCRVSWTCSSLMVVLLLRVVVI